MLHLENRSAEFDYKYLKNLAINLSNYYPNKKIIIYSERIIYFKYEKNIEVIKPSSLKLNNIINHLSSSLALCANSFLWPISYLQDIEIICYRSRDISLMSQKNLVKSHKFLSPHDSSLFFHDPNNIVCRKYEKDENNNLHYLPEELLKIIIKNFNDY